MDSSSIKFDTRDERRNFACLVWVGSVFALGWSEVMVVLQPLLVHYEASNTQIGMVQGALIATFPGMILSPWITRLFRFKKVYLYAANSLYLLPIGLIGFIVWMGFEIDGPSMLRFIVVLMLAGQLAAGFGGLPNQEFFAACIPMRLRGRLAGATSAIGGLLGIGGAAFAGWLLGFLPEPQGFGAVLVLAWFLCQVADTGILFAKEKPTPVEKSPSPWSKGMLAAFFSDTKFLKITLLVCLISPVLGQLTVFASVFAFRELGFAPQMAAWLAMCTAIARVVLSPLAGWTTDRWGARNSLLLWPVLTAMGFLPLALLPGTITVFAATALAAVCWSGFSGAMNALTAGIPAPEHRGGHFTLLGLCMVAANSGGPLVAGWMFDRVSYRIGFAILGSASLAIVVLGLFVLRNLSAKAEDYH